MGVQRLDRADVPRPRAGQVRGADLLAQARTAGCSALVFTVDMPGQVLFTYLHLAASKECTDALIDRKVTGIAYETVELPDGSLPLLAPMSEVAGRLAPQVGAHTLMRAEGGRGVLMGGVSGVYAAKVVVIGAGVSGMNAAAIALGMQAEVVVIRPDGSAFVAGNSWVQGGGHGFVRFAYADVLKQAALHINPIIYDNERLAPLVAEHGMDFVKRTHPEARRFLQELGTSMRNVDPDIWTRPLDFMAAAMAAVSVPLMTISRTELTSGGSALSVTALSVGQNASLVEAISPFCS